jgi:hypothetical protein
LQGRFTSGAHPLSKNRLLLNFIILKKLSRDKRSSLFCRSIENEEKKVLQHWRQAREKFGSPPVSLARPRSNSVASFRSNISLAPEKRLDEVSLEFKDTVTIRKMTVCPLKSRLVVAHGLSLELNSSLSSMRNDNICLWE